MEHKHESDNDDAMRSSIIGTLKRTHPGPFPGLV